MTQEDKEQLWHSLSEEPVYPCDILVLSKSGTMHLYRYCENGVPSNGRTPTLHNLIDEYIYGWCYCNDLIP